MFIIYDVVFIILTILYIPILLIKRKWHGGFAQRFGFTDKSAEGRLSAGRNIWIHAVSVGEILAVESLIKSMEGELPEYNFIITATTQTGYKLAQSKFGAKHVVLYSPLDFSWAVSAYIRIIRPELYVCAETELWPNMFRFLSARNVPIVIVNGRISDKSFKGYKKIPWVTFSALAKVETICVQTQEDAIRMKSLGAVDKQIVVTGNMKFDNVSVNQGLSRHEFPFKNDELIFLAGSTHLGEEEIVLAAFKKLKLEFTRLRLILVPRHVERAQQVNNLCLNQNIAPVLYSDILKGKRMQSDDILLVDTIGHLRNLYPLADVIFIGKSLCGGGGQNVIEPAFCSKAIVVGPLTYNFRDVIELLKSKKAIVQIDDEGQMHEVLKQLLQDLKMRKELGENARSVVVSMQGATQKTLDRVLAALKG